MTFIELTKGFLDKHQLYRMESIEKKTYNGSVDTCRNLLFLFLLAVIFNLFWEPSLTILNEYDGYDSCVFKQMGLAILQGKEPYQDLFDHKGPLIYFVNALAIGLNVGRWGLFSLHVLMFYFTLLIWHRIATRIMGGGWKSYLPIIGALFMFVSMDGEGNCTEEWSLLPISYSLYFGIKELLQWNLLKRRDYFVLGLCSGIIAMLRVNNAAVPLCVFLLVVLICVRNKCWYRLKDLFVYTAVGFLFVILSVCIFFYIKWGYSSIEGIWFGSIQFNIDYARMHENSGTHPYNFILFISIALILTVYTIIMKRGKNNACKSSMLFLSFCYLLSFLSMGKSMYDQYLIVIVPLLMTSMAYAFSCNYIMGILFVISFLVVKHKPIIQNLFNTISGMYDNHEFYRQADKFVMGIPENEQSSIWNYNAGFRGLRILQRHNLTQCNRVILNFQLKYSPELFNENNGKLQIEKPKWVFTCPAFPYINKQDSLYINNNYKRVYTIQEDLPVFVYKRVN